MRLLGTMSRKTPLCRATLQTNSPSYLSSTPLCSRSRGWDFALLDKTRDEVKELGMHNEVRLV